MTAAQSRPRSSLFAVAFLIVAGVGRDSAIANGGCGAGGGCGGGGGHGGLANMHVESAHFEGGQGFPRKNFGPDSSARYDRSFRRHHWYQSFSGGHHSPYESVTSNHEGYYAAVTSDSGHRPDPIGKVTLRSDTQQAARGREAGGTPRIIYKRRFPPQHRSDPPQSIRVAEPLATQPPLIASIEAPEALP